MPEIPFYQVDAFVEGPFSGNPAAVCILDQWLPDSVLQAIAMENNLSETAFLVRNKDGFHIRWFTPATEVKLCGHATLAASHILVCEGYWDHATIKFESLSGELTVEATDKLVSLNFPSQPPLPFDPPEELWAALGIPKGIETYKNVDIVVLVAHEEIVKKISPDFALLGEIPARGVIVTAPGNDVDFVSRFFGPRVGVNEDPVTGSAHCLLTPFWAKRLHKSKLTATQVSHRGGQLMCEQKNDRVIIRGRAKTIIKGTFYLPSSFPDSAMGTLKKTP